MPSLTTPVVTITPGAVLQLNSGGSVGNLVDNGSLIFCQLLALLPFSTR